MRRRGFVVRVVGHRNDLGRDRDGPIAPPVPCVPAKNVEIAERLAYGSKAPPSAAEKERALPGGPNPGRSRLLLLD